METLSICLVCADFPPNQIGGQGIYTYELAMGLARKGHDVKVITSLLKESVEVKHITKEQFEVYSVSSRNPLYFSFLAKKNFNNIIKKDDIIHGNDIYYSSFCLRRSKNVKIIGTAHNTYLQRMQSYKSLRKIIYPPLIAIEKRTYLSSDRVIAVSNRTRDALFRYNLPESKISVVYNGANIEKFNPKIKDNFLRRKLNLSEHSQIVLFVGRLVTRKNPHVLLMACKELIKLSSDIHCVFVGKDNLETKLRKLASTYKISKNVHFLGFVPDEDLPKIYSESNVFVLPSLGEGLPLTLLEAAASGLPLIATKDATGDTPIIMENKNGYIVRPYDANDLAWKIWLALRKHEKMGKSSRRIVMRFFTWEKCLENVIQIYKSCVNQG
ncbi:MAG: glycosyltransferase family 4 protein [Archaeoglobus sp.]|nr:glycosyltransferase family 4 protein [Archaeoglobus sp.]